MGAIRKTVLSEPSGKIISLKINFNPSAGTWNKPYGPTTFGPLLF